MDRARPYRPRTGPSATRESLTPNVVNTLTLGIVRASSDRGQQGGPGGTVPDMKTFGSSIFQLPTAQSGIRNFGVSGDFTLGNFTDGKFIRNTGGLRELVSWNKGKHDLTLATIWNWISRTSETPTSRMATSTLPTTCRVWRWPTSSSAINTPSARPRGISPTRVRIQWASTATTSGRSRRASP